jgi:hypothetical protein
MEKQKLNAEDVEKITILLQSELRSNNHPYAQWHGVADSCA